MKLLYYLAIDNCGQWFGKIFSYDKEKNKVVEEEALSNDVFNCSYIRYNILFRENHPINKDNILFNEWAVWTISEIEYNRIKRLNALSANYNEYVKLSSVEK